VGYTFPPEPPATDAAQPKQHSIAVLPFADVSPEGDNEYFSDGLDPNIRG
jgi:TolB-like protein